MSRDTGTREGIALFAALALLIAIAAMVRACNPGHVEAQDRGNPEALISAADVDPRETARRDPALLLAQALIAEAGWTVRNDHVAILYVLLRRSTLPAFQRDDGLLPECRVALAYVRAFHPRGALSDRQRRMRALDWPLLEERAPGVARLTRGWVAGTRPPDPCAGRAWHWGSRVDTRGMPTLGCGDGNRFVGAPVRIVALPVSVGPVPARVAAGRFAH